MDLSGQAATWDRAVCGHSRRGSGYSNEALGRKISFFQRFLSDERRNGGREFAGDDIFLTSLERRCGNGNALCCREQPTSQVEGLGVTNVRSGLWRRPKILR
jgi:hypothetical protein